MKTIQISSVVIAFLASFTCSSRGLRYFTASMGYAGTNDNVRLRLSRGVEGASCRTGVLEEGWLRDSWSPGDVETYVTNNQDFGDCDAFEADGASIGFTMEKDGSNGLEILKMEFHIGDETYTWTGKAFWDPTHDVLIATCSAGNCRPIHLMSTETVICTDDDPCLCKPSQSPCRFTGYPGMDDYTGYPGMEDYSACVTKGHEYQCCPSQWRYNNNSLDVTCIKDTEQVIGPGSVNTADVKRCSDPENPACREVSGETYIHSCRSPHTPCSGSSQPCAAGEAFCLYKDTCVEIGDSWTTACHKERHLSATQYYVNMGVGLGIFGLIMCLFIGACCYWSRQENAIFREQARKDTGRIELRDNKGKALSSDEVRCCWTWLDRSTFCGGTIQNLNRMRGLEHVARVDNNPDYEYGEAGENIEIVDFNPYYEAGNEDGVAEIVDSNPYYGRGDG